MSHPDRDCEDCGLYHFAWSAHDADRRHREHLDGHVGVEAELLFGQYERLIEGASPEVLELVLPRITRHTEDLDDDLRRGDQ